MNFKNVFSIVRVSALAAVCVTAASLHAEPSVIGKWRSTKVSGIQYQNATTGAPAPTNGSSFVYDFHPDGTYRHDGLMQMVAYNCTTKLFGYEVGRYRVEGSRIVLNPESGEVNTNNNCSGRSTSEKKTLGNRTLGFRFESSPSGPMMVLGGDDGKTRPDYFKREQ